jgi:serine/threonine-protein kinase RIO1
MIVDRATIIDMPQVVEVAGNNNARQILRRALRNLTEHLARFDARLLRVADCGDALFHHGEGLFALRGGGQLGADGAPIIRRSMSALAGAHQDHRQPGQHQSDGAGPTEELAQAEPGAGAERFDAERRQTVANLIEGDEVPWRRGGLAEADQ